MSADPAAPANSGQPLLPEVQIDPEPAAAGSIEGTYTVTIKKVDDKSGPAAGPNAAVTSGSSQQPSNSAGGGSRRRQRRQKQKSKKRANKRRTRSRSRSRK